MLFYAVFKRSSRRRRGGRIAHDEEVNPAADITAPHNTHRNYSKDKVIIIFSLISENYRPSATPHSVLGTLPWLYKAMGAKWCVQEVVALNKAMGMLSFSPMWAYEDLYFVLARAARAHCGVRQRGSAFSGSTFKGIQFKRSRLQESIARSASGRCARSALYAPEKQNSRRHFWRRMRLQLRLLHAKGAFVPLRLRHRASGLHNPEHSSSSLF